MDGSTAPVIGRRMQSLGTDAGQRHLASALACAVLLCLLALFPTGAALTAPFQEADTPALPFAPGERFVYRVDWNPPWYLFFLPAMEAGKAELKLEGDADHQGRKALKIVFAAHSSGTLVKLAGVKVDDYYEFLTDPDTFCTYSVLKREREGKRKRDIEVVYLRESQRLHIKEVDLAVNPPKLRKDGYVNDIPACVRDVFSALYPLRTKDIAAGTRVRTVVGDNERIKEVETHAEKKETVETPSGKYNAWRLDTVALMGGLFREGGQFKIWLTADNRKLPVQFEVKVNLGKVTGKVTEFSPKPLAGELRSRP
jgi:hypothetical protein